MNSSIPRQILVRIGFLLAALLAINLSILGGLALVERHAIGRIVADEHEEHGRLIDGILSMADKPLHLFVESYARRTVLTRPDGRTAEAESVLNAGLRTHELDAAWVLEADGSVRFQITSSGTPPQPPPLPTPELVRLQSRQVHFFVARLGTTYEVRGARLAANGTAPQAPRGWIFAAKRWDGTGWITAALPGDAHLEVIPPAEMGRAPGSSTTVRIERTLRDFAGVPVAGIRLDGEPPEVALMGAANRVGLMLVGVFGVITIGLSGFCFWRWIVIPAGAMRRSLAIQDPRPLQPLFAAGGEMEILAELVQDSMATRRQLEETLKERARLSRDLHDGVIQTIYAAGMNIAGARTLIESHPAVAAARLDRTCAALNSAVLDVRSFIRDLEPEALDARMFRLNVESVCALLLPIRPVEMRTKIDDTVCARLTPDQRRHALQVIREALANSLRHSSAATVTVRLQARAGGSVVEIEDDGTGFDPAVPGDGGGGLKNLVSRAAEVGGALEITRVRPHGTCVRLTLPFPFPR